MAQVTVYGLVDVGYGSTETTAVASGVTTKTERSSFGNAGQASGSRLGFSGTEDLGGGMKAGFVYELGLDPTESNLGGALPPGSTATAPVFGSNRQAFVSLSGGFGEVRLGRQYTGHFAVNATHDAGSTVGAPGYLPASAQPGDWPGQIHANNVVRYQAPAISGLTISAALIQDKDEITAGTTKTTQVETSATSVTASYAAGPLSAMVNVLEGEGRTSPTAVSDLSRVNVGVTYNLGMLSLHVTHNQREIDDKGTATNADSDYSDTNIGVKIPLGAATIWASTGEGELKNKGSSTSTVEYSAYQVGVVYALSKRTNMYAYIGEDEGKVKNSTNKTTNEGMFFGIRHSF
jgi:predicted porin